MAQPKTFQMTSRIRAQVKRLEIGPFVHSAEYNHPFAQTTWPTEEMTFFYVAYGQHLMGVKIREKVRIEWYFEDISKIAVVKATASNGHDVEFVMIQLNKAPVWTAKSDSTKRTRSSWATKSSVRRGSPPSQMAAYFVDTRANAESFGLDPDDISSDGRNLLMALSPIRETWEAYFSFAVQAGLLTNYDPSVLRQLEAEGPKLVSPFPEAAWFQEAATCANCDDGATEATVLCIDCQTPLCKSCDIVLHKSDAKSVHQRRTLAKFPEDDVARRAEAPPCTCERGQKTPCPCAEAMLYCTDGCQCRAINDYNYGPDSKDVPALAKAAYVPKRLRKMTSAYQYERDDRFLSRFVHHNRGANNDDELNDNDLDD